MKKVVKENRRTMLNNNDSNIQRIRQNRFQALTGMISQSNFKRFAYQSLYTNLISSPNIQRIRAKQVPIVLHASARDGEESSV